MQYSSQSYLSLPLEPGVYEFFDKDGELLYVGKAKSLRKRVSSYFTSTGLLGDKTRVMVGQIDSVRVTVVESELEALLLEAAFIKKNNPKYNSRLTDGKAYPLIQITQKDEYPKVLIARRPEDPLSLYFGPYPNTSAMKSVLKIIRRIFPFENVRNHPKKPCLYHHLGLCPCGEAFNSPEIKKLYKKNIRHIIHFLDGDKKTVLEELKKERDEYSSQEMFEQAALVQKQIDAVIYVTSPSHKPFEYEVNPNLREDLRNKEIDDLREHLKSVGVITEKLRKIECYDISNTSGQHATGSMVVFIDGEADKNLYRRFKITKDIVGPNDFAMMKHVLKRRLKHAEWKYPDLIIVDGGKGQISLAMEAVTEAAITIPLVGLAKREETIITPDFKNLSLPKDSDALLLVTRIRNEAHRFAITYHRKLRAKATFE